jgi:diguanylate cyclase (GGDEF)-like protein
VLEARLAGDEVDCCVLLLDLDRFKPVNDRFGHAAGDAVLAAAAARMRAAVRNADLVARVGGDEFAVLLPDCDDPGRVAEKLLATLSEPTEFQGVAVTIGASIGISRAPRDGASTAELLRAADRALYRAKAAGRSCVREDADGSSVGRGRRVVVPERVG